MLHDVLKAGYVFSRYFVLLVFVNPLKEKISNPDITQWTAEIAKKISLDLGSGYVPDKMEFFTLMPKRNAAGVDRNWCANGYNSGLLMQKRDFPHYQMIGSLKKLAQEFSKNKMT